MAAAYGMGMTVAPDCERGLTLSHGDGYPGGGGGGGGCGARGGGGGGALSRVVIWPCAGGGVRGPLLLAPARTPQIQALSVASVP